MHALRQRLCMCAHQAIRMQARQAEMEAQLARLNQAHDVTMATLNSERCALSSS